MSAIAGWRHWALGLLFVFSASSVSAQDEALRNYVAKPDPTYSWKIARTIDGNPSKTFVVKLTSQAWRGAADVDRTTWDHWLIVVVPQKITSSTAFLMIGGGANGGEAPEKADGMTTQIARATGSVVAELKQTPNQPLVFHNDGVKRSEDDLIAYAWDKYMATKDPTWLPRLPMVKGAVRAMDCIQELLASPEGGGHKIEKFTVAGGSKRGWTTWMTGVADPRVQAIVPIVIDVVNVDTSMRHHASVYGFWALAIGDYVHHKITQRWDSPELRALLQIEDPYFHRDRLTMPKFIVNAAGDQFFCPDSSQFYFDDLKGEKLLRYVPNADHSLRGSDAVESVAAFYSMVINDKPRPEFSWKFADDGSIRVVTKDKPRAVKLWQATNPEARDFRLMTIGPAYKSVDLTAEPDGSYVGRVTKPEKGWTAYFVELTYDSGLPVPLKVTTAIRIAPDKLPYANINPNDVPYEADVKKK